jgi:hypothetical protein
MSDQRGPEPDAASIKAGHEQSDARIRPLGVFLAVLAGSLVVVAGAMALLFRLFMTEAEETDPPPSPLAAAEREAEAHVPGPLLEVASGLQVEQLRARERQRLSATEWIDETEGIARIPIEQAMAITAERGLPEWPAVAEESPEEPKQ